MQYFIISEKVHKSDRQFHQSSGDRILTEFWTYWLILCTPIHGNIDIHCSSNCIKLQQRCFDYRLTLRDITALCANIGQFKSYQSSGPVLQGYSRKCIKIWPLFPSKDANAQKKRQIMQSLRYLFHVSSFFFYFCV